MISTPALPASASRAAAGAAVVHSSHTGVLSRRRGELRRRRQAAPWNRARSAPAKRSRPGSRQVSSGSSAATVPAPTRIASCVARRRWPSARAASPVIHLLSPEAVAMRPSSEVASLRWNSGRPSRTRSRKPALISAASLRPLADFDGDARRPAAGHGPARSPADRDPPAPTRRVATPAATSASAQGGDLPKCEHGSSVT